jgi:hypothetical protein
VIVDRLLGLSNTESAATAFTDSSTIAIWAKGSVDAAIAKGIMKGYADNSFKPSKSITRAEAVVALDRAVAAKVTVYNTAGTYGPATGTEVINGDVAINVAGVTLQNLEINGKLLFAAGIGSGDAFLTNVTVKGDTTVNGGGVNSLHLKNSKLAKVIINAAIGPVRVVAEGSTTVALVDVSSPVVIQEDGTTGTGFGDVTLNKDLPAGSDVALKGTFDNVIILGDKANVELPEGTTITKFKTDTDTTVTGKGTIATAELGKESKTTFETKPTASTIDGKATPVPTPGPTPGPTPNPTPNPTPDPTPPVALKGTVMGSVYQNISQDEQIVGVIVNVYSGIQGSGSQVSTVQSGPDGEYSISNVPVGNYYLMFVKEGYMDLTVTPTNHTVSANATTDALTAYMYRNLVTGYVKDTSGNPISNLYMDLYDDDDIFHTSTADDGSFYFYDVPAVITLHVNIRVTDGFAGGYDTDLGDVTNYDSGIGSVSTNGANDIGTIELKSRDKRLSSLALSGITLIPAFSSNNYDYYARVSYSDSEISTTVSATTMYANATINQDILEPKVLVTGFNTIEVDVYPESDEGNDTYYVFVWLETEAETLARESAVAVIEAFTGEDIDFIDVINTATGLETAVDANYFEYILAVIAAANGALDTSEEIAALVDSVNNEAQLIAIATIEAFNNESSDVDLLHDLKRATIELDSSIFAELLSQYKEAIIAALDGELDTSEEIGDLVISVNNQYLT